MIKHKIRYVDAHLTVPPDRLAPNHYYSARCRNGMPIYLRVSPPAGTVECLACRAQVDFRSLSDETRAGAAPLATDCSDSKSRASGFMRCWYFGTSENDAIDVPITLQGPRIVRHVIVVAALPHANWPARSRKRVPFDAAELFGGQYPEGPKPFRFSS